MADVTDVGNALLNLIAQVVYPSGTISSSIINADVKIYQGWAISKLLDDDLPLGKVHITVFPRPDEKIHVVNFEDWQEIANNGTTGTLLREVRRQTRTFQVTIWAKSFDVRDALASKLDSALSVVDRLVMPDQTQTLMRYVNSVQDDDQQKQGIYRRDLFYQCDYATAVTQTAYAVKEVDVITEVKTGLQPL